MNAAHTSGVFFLWRLREISKIFFGLLSRRSFGPDIGEQHTIRVYRSATERER
jgi:hypothetical protein